MESPASKKNPTLYFIVEWVKVEGNGEDTSVEVVDSGYATYASREEALRRCHYLNRVSGIRAYLFEEQEESYESV